MRMACSAVATAADVAGVLSASTCLNLHLSPNWHAPVWKYTQMGRRSGSDDTTAGELWAAEASRCEKNAGPAAFESLESCDRSLLNPSWGSLLDLAADGLHGALSTERDETSECVDPTRVLRGHLPGGGSHG